MDEADFKVHFSGSLNERKFYNRVFRFIQKVPLTNFETLFSLIKKQGVLYIRSQSPELIGFACFVGILGQTMQSKLQNVYPVYSSDYIGHFNLQGYQENTKSMIKLTIYQNTDFSHVLTCTPVTTHPPVKEDKDYKALL